MDGPDVRYQPSCTGGETLARGLRSQGAVGTQGGGPSESYAPGRAEHRKTCREGPVCIKAANRSFALRDTEPESIWSRTHSLP